MLKFAKSYKFADNYVFYSKMRGGGIDLLCDAMQHLLLVLPEVSCTRLTVHKPKSRYHALSIIAELLGTYIEGWG